MRHDAEITGRATARARARTRKAALNIREITGLARVIAVLTIDDLKDAVPLARALYAGGLPVIEVSLRTPVALAAVEAMRKAVPLAVVGVGSLARAVDFAAAGRAGAQFGVTPGFTPDLAAASRGARFPLMPGVMTPTDVLEALAAGFNVCRFFPAEQAGGVAMLRALGAVFPDVLFCPSGDLMRDSAVKYLALANVAGVGGSWLSPAGLVAAGDWTGIEALARDAAGLT